MDRLLVNFVGRAVLQAVTVMVAAGFLLAAGPVNGSPRAWAGQLPDDLMVQVRRRVVAGELLNQRLALLVELARALARTNPDRGAEVLEAVWGQLGSRDVAEAQLTGKRLEQEVLWAGAEDKAAAKVLARRLDATARPVRLWMDLASAWLPLNPDRAEETIRQAVPLVRRNPQSMDFELRMLAGLAVAVNRPLAESLATAIRAPEVRSWAYLSMGRRLGSSKDPAAATYYGLALQAAAQTRDPLQRVLATVHVAEAWSLLDAQKGELVFDEAAHLVGRIENREYAAYALSCLGSAWGKLNTRKAYELAWSIPSEHAAERFRIYMDLAEAAENGPARQGLLEEAHREALHMPVDYEREKSLGRVACLMAPLALDRAQEILLELSPGIDFVRDEVWQALAWSAVPDVPRSEDLAAHINDKFVKVSTLAFLAEKVYAIGEAEGLRILESGQRSAEGLTQSGPWAALALAWANYSGRKACQAAALVSGFTDRALAYARVAGRLKALGREVEAAEAWESALAAALDKDQPNTLLRARTLKEIADLWAPWAPDEAEVVYETACRITAG